MSFHSLKPLYDAGRARGRELTEDQARADFLARLDAAPFEVTEWEADFLESYLSAPPLVPSFSPKQRQVIDRMRDTYEGRLL